MSLSVLCVGRSINNVCYLSPRSHVWYEERHDGFLLGARHELDADTVSTFVDMWMRHMAKKMSRSLGIPPHDLHGLVDIDVREVSLESLGLPIYALVDEKLDHVRRRYRDTNIVLKMETSANPDLSIYSNVWVEVQAEKRKRRRLLMALWPYTYDMVDYAVVNCYAYLRSLRKLINLKFRSLFGGSKEDRG